MCRADTRGTLTLFTVKHLAAVLDPMKAGELVRAITTHFRQPVTRTALLLSALLLQRPGAIRAMEGPRWTPTRQCESSRR